MMMEHNLLRFPSCCLDFTGQPACKKW